MVNIQKIGNMEMEKDEKIQTFSNKKNVALLAFIDSYVPKKIDTVKYHTPTISILDEIAIENMLTDIKQNCKKIPDDLYLLINTCGGGLNSSFKIAKAIRNTFKNITVFIPHVAASGGTLLALTGNKIRMGIMSQLGPLDPQISYGDYGSVPANSWDRVKSRFDKILNTLDDDEINYSDKHMAESFDPIIHELCNNACATAEIYVKFILKKTGYKESKCEKLSQDLIYSFPSHDFVIDENLAKEIGLSIESSSNAREWDLMRNWFGKYVTTETDIHFIRYCVPKNN